MFVNAENYQGTLKVGQRIHSILYGGRDGIIFGIKGTQSPDSVRTIGGVMSTCGRAMFDVVFDNGTIGRSIPESVVRGVQWRISDEVVGQLEIDQALAVAEATRLAEEEAERLARIRRAEYVEQIKRENPHLKQRSENKGTPWATGAANLRKELHLAFPGVKFSVKSECYSGGCSINVKWDEDVDQKAVEEIADKYEYGAFDAMQDLAYTIDNPWSDVFGGAKYVFCQKA